MTVKILLLGNTGQVGWELNRTLLTLGELKALDYPQVNMANAENIRLLVRETQPNLIVNATAYTNVDKAESESELAMAINATSVSILAEEARRLGAALIHYSTDYVFDGRKGTSYNEDDAPSPLSVYGATKLAGEQAIKDIGGAYLTFRTSWVYSLRRPSFVTKVLEWARQHKTLRIVDDQISSPTWARTLAEATAQVIAQGRDDPVGYLQEKHGLYHLTDRGSCSRYEWARAIIELDPQKEEQAVKEILPAKSDEFPTSAQRPLNSAMNCGHFIKTFSPSLPAWKQTLALAMNESR
ncbi:MAG: dTDP-4-dehydrorhamnose reductase [Chloroflexi bacterium]|nr:dTDP-4-dehydrorhamnose reductase [Chloroflexota bacterium]